MNNNGSSIVNTIPNAFSNYQSQPIATQSISQNSKVLPLFLNRFINQEFIEKIINISLYQADFSSLSTRTVDVVKFIQKFLKDSQQEVHKCPAQYFQLPKKTIISSLSLAEQVLQLREDVSSRLVNYDNVTQHFAGHKNLNNDKLLKAVCTNRIKDIDSFRSHFEVMIQTIQSFNEIQQIHKTLGYWDVFLDQTDKESLSVLNMIKNFRDLVALSYNDLSVLTTVTKNEQLEDYMVLSDSTSVKKVVKNLLTFLSTGYSFYKTGYSLIDENIGGLESSTLHLITGPSNHAKSIFMINLCKNLVLYNAESFKDDDALVFITLEDKHNCPLY